MVGRDWGNGEPNGISLDCLETTFSKNMDHCAREDYGMKSLMEKNCITLEHTNVVTNSLLVEV